MLVPIDLLFIPSNKINANILAPSHLPIILHKPLMDLFAFLINGKGSADSYLHWYEENHPQKEVDQRILLTSWQRRIRRFRWFPIALSRPVVADLCNDRLVLESGEEYACLAKFLGKSWIGVQMTPEASSHWSMRSSKNLCTLLKETNRKLFYNPILHPDFRKAKVSRPDSIRLDLIRRFLGPFGEGLTGLDIGCNMGYMCHMLQRQGIQMTGVDHDTYHLSLAMALNSTYRLNVEFIHSRFEDHKPAANYDIVSMFSVFYHTFNRNISEASRMIAKIDSMTRNLLLWESGDQPQQEIDFIRSHSGLTQYLFLGKTEGTGKNRELGVFLRPSSALSQTLINRHQTEFLSECI